MSLRHHPSFDYNGHQARGQKRFTAPKIAFAMITLTYAIVDGDGDVVTVSTWAVGTSAKVALKHWLESRPDISPDSVTHVIVTESKLKLGERYEALGERVEVPDPYLASVG
jgi:hypothetical protein